MTDRTDRRALLIDAAEALFEERPYDEVTAAEIAGRAGVAYGLIAHYFVNKRGLYLASLGRAAERMRATHLAPPSGDTPAARLRDALTRHISFLEEHAQAFVSLMHGGSGSDPRVRAIIDDFRWQGAARTLLALGVTGPLRPSLRTAMRGWIGFLEDAVLDHLEHRELTRDELVELAVAALAAALSTATALDPQPGIAPGLPEKLTGDRRPGRARARNGDGMRTCAF